MHAVRRASKGPSRQQPVPKPPTPRPDTHHSLLKVSTPRHLVLIPFAALSSPQGVGVTRTTSSVGGSLRVNFWWCRWGSATAVGQPELPWNPSHHVLGHLLSSPAPTRLCRDTEGHTKQVEDISIPLEIHKCEQGTENNRFGENMGLKNKPNLKIKTILTQKDEFVLEAGNCRFNCVDLSFFFPSSSLPQRFAGRGSEHPGLRFILYDRRRPCLPTQTPPLTLASSAIKRTRTSHLKFDPHTSKKLL